MMMYWVEIVDAAGNVLRSSRYFTRRKDAEAKRIEMEDDPLLQLHPTSRLLVKSELSEPESWSLTR